MEKVATARYKHCIVCYQSRSDWMNNLYAPMKPVRVPRKLHDDQSQAGIEPACLWRGCGVNSLREINITGCCMKCRSRCAKAPLGASPLRALRVHATAVMSCAPSPRCAVHSLAGFARLARERCLLLVSVAARCAATGVEASALRASSHVCAPAHPAGLMAAAQPFAAPGEPVRPPRGLPPHGAAAAVRGWRRIERV